MGFIKPIILSFFYWVFAIFVSQLAYLAPCGLAPGAWCEQEGPNWFGTVLGKLGPDGVLLIAAIIYVVVLGFNVRARKGH